MANDINNKEIENAEQKVSEETKESKRDFKEEKKSEKADKKSAKKENKLKKENEELKTQLKEAKDMLLRTAAEFDNYKKRETAAKEKLSSYVKGETLKELIPAIDNINLALAADETQADYIKGVSMTIKGLMDCLSKIGLEEINPVGEQFDVNYHMAVMKVEDESVGENIVTKVLQTGYKLGENVLRPAMVEVANCD